MSWALQKPRGGGSRFLERVKEYPTTRFRKADLVQVAADMRKARETVEN